MNSNMKIRQTLIYLAASILLAASCEEQKPVVEKEVIVFTDGEAIWYGDDGNTEVSDMWNIRLYTDMERDQAGNPVGPGQMIQISCNTDQDSEANADNLRGLYVTPQDEYDYSQGTFNPGYMVEIELPDGIISAPAMSYFGILEAGSTVPAPDFLEDGSVSIKINADATFTIEGWMTSQSGITRDFTYTGEPVIIDKISAQKRALRQYKLDTHSEFSYLGRKHGTPL